MKDPTRPDIATTDITYIDGYGTAAGARLVTPAEYEKATADMSSLVARVVTRALCLAADESGALINFMEPTFFEGPHFAKAMDLEPDDAPLAYSPFIFMVLAETMHYLTLSGFLAHRGNGDSVDYHLALPAGVA